MDDYRAFFSAGGVPVVIALAELVKHVVPNLDKRWVPLVVLVLSAAWQGLGIWVIGTDPREAVTYAVVAALAAIGLFSGVRATAGK